MKELYLQACEILRITSNTQLLEGFNEEAYSKDRFSLSTNYIGDKGARAILPVLKQNSSLKYLNFGGQGIKSSAAFDIAEYFRFHPGILTIDLRNNKIGVKGASALYQLFLKNESLKQICMEGNTIGWELLSKFETLHEDRERETMRFNPTIPDNFPQEWIDMDIEESQSLAPIYTASPSLTNFSIFDSQKLPFPVNHLRFVSNNFYNIKG